MESIAKKPELRLITTKDVQRQDAGLKQIAKHLREVQMTYNKAFNGASDNQLFQSADSRMDRILTMMEGK